MLSLFPLCLFTGALQSTSFAYKGVIVLCVRKMWHGLFQNAVDYNERKFLTPVDHLLTFMSLQICDFLFSVEILTIFYLCILNESVHKTGLNDYFNKIMFKNNSLNQWFSLAVKISLKIICN